MECMLVHAHLKSWVHFCSHVIGWLTFYLKQGWCLEQLLFLSGKLSLPLFLFHVFWVEWMPQSGGWGVFPGLHDLFGVDVWTDRGQKNTITHFLGVLRRAHTFESDWSLQNITLVLLEHHIAMTELENEAILMGSEMRVGENPDSGDIIWASGLSLAWSLTSTLTFLLTLDFCLGFCHFQRKGPNWMKDVKRSQMATVIWIGVIWKRLRITFSCSERMTLMERREIH